MLDKFIKLTSGYFNNKEQARESDFVFCEHNNIVLTKEIKNLPHNFNGDFILQNFEYKDNKMPYLFLYNETSNGIKLTSYKLPTDLNDIDYLDLEETDNFEPIIYSFKDNIYECDKKINLGNGKVFYIKEKISEERIETSRVFLKEV